MHPGSGPGTVTLTERQRSMCGIIGERNSPRWTLGPLSAEARDSSMSIRACFELARKVLAADTVIASMVVQRFGAPRTISRHLFETNMSTRGILDFSALWRFDLPLSASLNINERISFGRRLIGARRFRAIPIVDSCSSLYFLIASMA